jgi:hypothetical protein
MERKSFLEKHPWIFAIALILGMELILISVSFIESKLGLYAIDPLAGLSEIPVLAIVLVIIWKLRWWREIGLRKPKNLKVLLFFIPAIPMFIGSYNTLPYFSIRDQVYFILVAIIGGITEELVFRGLLLRVLRPKPLWVSICVPAIIFGLLHFVNYQSTGVIHTILLVNYAIALGFCGAIMVTRSGILWPMMIAHAMFNFLSFVGPRPVTDTNGYTIASDVIRWLSVWYLVAGLFLLEGIKEKMGGEQTVEAAKQTVE